MYFLYSLLLAAGVVVLAPRFVYLAWRHGKYVAGIKERFGGGREMRPSGQPVVWLHCVSVGETMAARPLVAALRARYPDCALIVSTTTATGQQVARESFAGTAAQIIYFPLDFRWTVRRALRRVRPSLVLLMETEVWPHFIRECRAQNVPVAVINGRISPTSFRRYRRIQPFFRRVLNQLSLAAVQTDADAARLANLGIQTNLVRVTGNLKFDAQSLGAGERDLAKEIAARFQLHCPSLLLIAASTHEPEERIVLEAFRALRARCNARQKPRLMIAPRHPERFGQVAALLNDSGLVWAKRSASPAADDPLCDVVLLDTVGELRAMYPLAATVFVGGSIAPTGGHNVLEPALEGCCVVTGAHTHNFAGIIAEFVRAEALIQLPPLEGTAAAHALADCWHELHADEGRRNALANRARAAAHAHRGATARTLALLEPLLQC